MRPRDGGGPQRPCLRCDGNQRMPPNVPRGREQRADGLTSDMCTCKCIPRGLMGAHSSPRALIRRQSPFFRRGMKSICVFGFGRNDQVKLFVGAKLTSERIEFSARSISFCRATSSRFAAACCIQCSARHRAWGDDRVSSRCCHIISFLKVSEGSDMGRLTIGIISGCVR